MITNRLLIGSILLVSACGEETRLLDRLEAEQKISELYVASTKVWRDHSRSIDADRTARSDLAPRHARPAGRAGVLCDVVRSRCQWRLRQGRCRAVAVGPHGDGASKTFEYWQVQAVRCELPQASAAPDSKVAPWAGGQWSAERKN